MKKLAVVTGGTQGIGKALVNRFLREDWLIATCARSQIGLDQLAEEQGGAGIFSTVADLSNRAGISTFSSFVESLPHVPEVLVHNTGVFLPGGILDEPDDQLETMMNTNLYSAYHLSRALVPAMIAQGRGHIFNVASIASLVGYPSGGSYAITKHAQLGLSRALREELKPKGIRVTAVMPGAVHTRSWDGLEIAEERFMKPEDIAETIWSAYSLSDRTVVEEIILRPQLGDV
ncbi:MAG TPA: short-chain dehydrogenase [Cytophagales bacterium]|nr:short-chain dehydrogenase [Cytophagales bacterium]HAA17889.1 short-chain dehydrogenase [Cytophagales bacterium]HAP58189.1 short-chain dehydrogenase [Cytophagales bacterium]